jgi:hypothetical protein
MPLADDFTSRNKGDFLLLQANRENNTGKKSSLSIFKDIINWSDTGPLLKFFACKRLLKNRIIETGNPFCCIGFF